MYSATTTPDSHDVLETTLAELTLHTPSRKKRNVNFVMPATPPVTPGRPSLSAHNVFNPIISPFTPPAPKSPQKRPQVSHALSPAAYTPPHRRVASHPAPIRSVASPARQTASTTPLKPAYASNKRYIVIRGVDKQIDQSYLLHILHSEYGAMRIYIGQLAKEGWIVLALHDINLVPAVLSCLEDEERFSAAGSALALTHLSRADLVNLLPETHQSRILSDSEGFVQIRSAAGIDANLIRQLAVPIGLIKTVTVVELGSYLVEFYDDRAPRCAVSALHQTSINGLRLCVSVYDWSARASVNQDPFAVDPFSPPAFRSVQGDSVKSPTRRPSQTAFTSPLRPKGSSKLPFVTEEVEEAEPPKVPVLPSPFKTSTRTYGSLRSTEDVPVHNHLDLDRIANGLERRTTVMLKNVANRMTQDQLRQILQSVVPGAVDFIYLRIDYKTGNNLGYGFVNFTSSEALLHFVDAKLGTHWSAEHSSKLVQMCFADTQGQRALIQKFRNSRVMKEDPAWRPQLVDSEGNLVPFPPPNDMIAHTKSLNSAHYGLFESSSPAQTKVFVPVETRDVFA